MMKVLIVAKTRRGSGACVGGITEDGRSVRLIAADAETNDHAGLEYNVGDVWEIESHPDSRIVPPHVENNIVLCAQRLRSSSRVESVVRRFMPPASGGPEKLFDGLLQTAPSGALYVAERTGLPRHSTMFWTPDQPLTLDCSGKRLHYRYPGDDGGQTLVFVGFQEPLKVIPAGTLLRVSLAHRWRPSDKDELRCYLQLSGWIDANVKVTAARNGVRALPPDQSRPTPAATNHAERAQRVLKQIFGYADFLPQQAEVVSRVLGGRDTMAVMPTGGGKSLCYQLPAVMFEGLTMVVSPLIALMEDQVRQLRQLNVPAAFLNSTVSHADYVATVNRARNGGVKLIYAAPETLLRPETLLLLEQSKLACLAVDEAHCISEWGHDFRPEYRQLAEIRRRFPRAVCLALTATATKRVREDVGQLLDIPSDGQFVASFNRPNLFLRCEPRENGLAQTLAFLEKHRGESGIIYCSTRKQVDELTAHLKANRWEALPYHAGLDDKMRRSHQERFINDETPLMVATIAFGMGINKANVRFVLHYNLPKDLESYYQEIGRAGRDALPAECLLLHSRRDATTIRYFIDEGAESQRADRRARLDAMMDFAEALGCRRLPLLAYFGETLKEPCAQCDHCAGTGTSIERIDATVAAQKFFSCIVQTGGVFGVAHIISVLRGSRSKHVLSRHHDRLPSYGSGREHLEEEWRGLAGEFIKLGLLETDREFGSLRLTSAGRSVLKSGEKVFVPKGKAVHAPAIKVGQDCSELFQRLRELRKELAEKAGMPAYIVFSDRALQEMAAVRPKDEGQFLSINGVGQAKLARYGNAFLRVIREHAQ